jgi:quercetin dioxygenase-like cupin family protein
MLETRAPKHYRWEDMTAEKLKGSITRRLITGDSMMIAEVRLAKGELVPKHAHHNEQITYITSGALKFALGDDGDHEVVVRAGEVLVIPSNLPHSAEALEDTVDIDVFSPPREDWLDGSDAYLRG